MLHHGYMGYFPGGHWLLLIVFVVLAVLLAMLFGKWKNGACQSRREDNVEILKNRLARGEISHEEFEKLKSVLTSRA